MTTLLSRILADSRQRRRAREARAAIRKAQRAAEMRARMENPGYDELSDPLFIIVMVLAVAVIVMDIRSDWTPSFLMQWARDAIDIVKGSWA